MGIDVYWKDEAGVILGEVADPRLLSRHLQPVRRLLADSKCLKFLDPVGDACFNQSQIPVLVDELQRVIPMIDDPPLRMHLEKVLALAQRADCMHTYLWFIGD